MVKNFVSFLSLNMRLALIYNGQGAVTEVIETASNTIENRKELLKFLYKFVNLVQLRKLLSRDDIKDILQQTLAEKYASSFNSYFHSSKTSLYELHQMFCSKILNIDGSVEALVVNGRIIEVPKNSPFIEADFNLLEKYITNSYVEKLISELTKDEQTNAKRCSNLCMKLSSILTSSPQTKARHDVQFFGDTHSSLILEPSSSSQPAVDIVVVLDPLSR